jgi:hypothetical protein
VRRQSGIPSLNKPTLLCNEVLAVREHVVRVALPTVRKRSTSQHHFAWEQFPDNITFMCAHI